MDRLDLELYADRLGRHAERLADDIAAARLRLVWGDVERRARGSLAPGDGLQLEALGVLQPEGAGGDDHALIERRRRQLDALGRLQAFVERELQEMTGAERPPLTG